MICINPQKTPSTNLDGRVVHQSPNPIGKAIPANQPEKVPQNVQNMSTDELLARLKLKPMECGGGGNCLLHSIIHQIADPREKTKDASTLRKLVLNEINKDIEKFEPEWKRLIGNDFDKAHKLSLLLGRLKELREQLKGTQPLYDDTIYYIAKYYGKNVFIIPNEPHTQIRGKENHDPWACRYYSHDMGNIDDVKHFSTGELLANEHRLRDAIGIYYVPGHYKALVPTSVAAR
jgi:hypothetical protein